MKIPTLPEPGNTPTQIADNLAQEIYPEELAEIWLAANREALDSSNAYVEEHGLPLAKYRMF